MGSSNTIPDRALHTAVASSYGRLTNSEIIQLWFTFCRACGKHPDMNPDRFAVYIRHLNAFKRASSTEDFRLLFRAYDCDRDGRISWEDFIRYHAAMAWDIAADGVADDLARVLFAMISGDGELITRHDVVSAIQTTTRWVATADPDSPEMVESIGKATDSIMNAVCGPSAAERRVVSEFAFIAACRTRPELLDKLCDLL
jgi:Ca2+-binding EF-hand superfamily protein